MTADEVVRILTTEGRAELVKDALYLPDEVFDLDPAQVWKTVERAHGDGRRELEIYVGPSPDGAGSGRGGWTKLRVLVLERRGDGWARRVLMSASVRGTARAALESGFTALEKQLLRVSPRPAPPRRKPAPAPSRVPRPAVPAMSEADGEGAAGVARAHRAVLVLAPIAAPAGPGPGVRAPGRHPGWRRAGLPPG
jgi:hypothetical protein